MIRFWAKVNKTEGCWLWTSDTGSRGYGRFCFEGTARPAHRFSWEMHNGPIPDGLCVLHRCDVRACVNPDHLFLGTVADNHRDMMAKGRWENQYVGKTECKRGHPFDASNTGYRADGRYCRKCHNFLRSSTRAARRELLIALGSR